MSESFSCVWTDLHGFNAGQIAIARLSKFGVRLPDTCRLLEAMRRIERSLMHGNVDTYDADYVRRVAESHRVLLEFYVISAALEEVGGFDRQRLAAAVRGNSDADSDTSTRARDAQFELLVTALIHHAGIQDVEVGEPDIRIRAGSDVFGVAAKRLSSEAQLTKRLRNAAGQLKRLGGYGVIALNLDQPLSRTAHLHGVDRARALFHETVLRSNDLIQSLSDGKYVAGIQAFGTLFGSEQIDGETAHSLVFLAHGHWVSPEEDLVRVHNFLSGRGAHLQTRIGELVSRLV